MNPVKLSISGFLSYKQKAELDFSSFKIACVSGANGAGKSTLFDAITWAMFGIARSRDDSLIHHSSEQAEVTLDFIYEDQLYRIQRIKPREKTTQLDFFVQRDDGSFAVLSEHAQRETQKKIESILKLDYETFINAAFFLQGKADLFTQQTPGDRKRILSNILGLDQWEHYRLHAAEMRRILEVGISALSGRLATIREELMDEDNRVRQLEQLQEERQKLAEKRKLHENTVEQARILIEAVQNQNEMKNMLTSQQENYKQKLENLQNRIQQREQEILEYQKIVDQRQIIEDGFAEFKNLSQRITEQQKQMASYHALKAKLQTTLMDIEYAQKQLLMEKTQLEKQETEIDAVNQQCASLNTALIALQEEIDALSIELEHTATLEEQAAVLREQQQQISAENTHLKQLMNELKEKIDWIKSQSTDNCPLCTQPLDQQHREQILASYEIEGKQYGDSHRTNQAAMQKLENNLKEIQRLQVEMKNKSNLREEKQRRADQLAYQVSEQSARVQRWQTDSADRLKTIRDMLRSEQYAIAECKQAADMQHDLDALAVQPETLHNLEQKLSNLQTFENQAADLQKALSAIGPLQREVTESQAEMVQTQKEQKLNQQSLEQIHQTLQSINQPLPDLKTLQQELDGIRQEESRAQMALGGAMQKVEVLASLKKQEHQLDNEIAAQNKQISALKQLEQAFSKDGIPALLIEQALPEIEEEANLLLERLTDGMMTVQFNTQSSYKDKKRADKKETLDILISDSAGPRPYEMYSGGEAFRVNFAIRLALSKVLARRAGARLQTLVIDEGFGSQDIEGRQRLIEVINLIRKDFEKILVITHLEELKDVFPARVEVEKTKTGSMIKVVSNL
jgi:exonuclease SbcC